MDEGDYEGEYDRYKRRHFPGWELPLTASDLLFNLAREMDSIRQGMGHCIYCEDPNRRRIPAIKTLTNEALLSEPEIQMDGNEVVIVVHLNAPEAEVRIYLEDPYLILEADIEEYQGPEQGYYGVYRSRRSCTRRVLLPERIVPGSARAKRTANRLEIRIATDSRARRQFIPLE